MAEMDFTKSFTIDGNKYTLTYLDPFDATDVLRDLGYVISPVIGALGGAVAGDKKLLAAIGDKTKMKDLTDEESDDSTPWGGASERALMGFFDNFSNSFQRELIEKMSAVTTVRQGDRDTPLDVAFPIHFRGKTMLLYKWLFASLKMQFGDLFEGIAPLISKFGQ